jgi:hypothetical protein
MLDNSLAEINATSAALRRLIMITSRSETALSQSRAKFARAAL